MQNRFLALDTETTGFSENYDRIVELAAVEVDPRTGEHGRHIHRYVNPLRKIENDQIHGITNERVANEPPFGSIAQEFVDFVRGATLAMHNSSFDSRMLDAELIRCGYKTLSQLNTQIVDTVDIARGIYPLIGSHSLDTLCQHLSISLAERDVHGALLDAHLLASTFPKMAVDYDFWLSTAEVGCAVSLDVFEQQLTELFLNYVAITPSEPPDIDLALARVATALRWIGARNSALSDTFSALLTDMQWSCKHFSATWHTTKSMSWKSAAEKFLTGFDFSSYKSESASYTVKPQTIPEVAADLDHFTTLLESEAVRTSPACLARGMTALNAAEKRLETFRDVLRSKLIAATQEGFTPIFSGVRPANRTSIDYKKAIEDHAPGADIESFRSVNVSLRAAPRNSEAARLLFGESRRSQKL